MDKNIFKYIWRFSSRQQLVIMAMTASSFPFLYVILELPKYIINDAIDGTDFPKELLGFEFGQIEYLLVLCAALLVLILIIALFSMAINTYKCVSAERMVRRLRYQLYDNILRFPKRHFQKVTPSELSSMITAEAEPLGDFIRDSFAMPMVEGGTMLTILYFMISEDPILGLVAISMVPVQAFVIPKLQRKINLLGRERVTRARHLAGRVGESVLGISDVHTNDASGYMRAEMTSRLAGIFNVRYELYQKKFFMKSLNVFLSQLTPLFFYSVGGYLTIKGDLSLGALVAVLSAYARFTTPWKELLRYYQRLNDARIKYEQLIEQFEPSEMLDAALQQQRPETIPRLKGAIDLRQVSVIDDGIKVLDGVTFRIEPGDHIAIVADPGSRDMLAHLIARLVDPTSGTISVGETNLSGLPEAITGAAIGYAGPDSYIFDGTLHHNLLYGIRHAPVAGGATTNERPPDYEEALASGNSLDDICAEWVDYESLGLSDEDDFKDWLLKIIHAVELDASLSARSLSMGLDPEKNPELAEKLVQARQHIAAQIDENPEYAELIYLFKFDQYNANASVAANFVFGEPVDPEFEFKTLGNNPYVRSVLEECELTGRFLAIGQKLAETLIELFGDLSPDEPLFEQYSFVDEETLQRLKGLTTLVEREGLDNLAEEDKTLLISLTFQLVVDRHRLGFIDDDMQERILKARRVFRDGLPEDMRGAIAFFDQEDFNGQLSNRCNLLMGRINYTVHNAEQRINAITLDGLDQLRLTEKMILHATEDPAGVGGSRLSQADRQKIALARSLIKKPDILVFNDALSSLDREAQARIRRNLFELLPDTTFVLIFGEKPDGEEFDQVLVIRDGRVEERIIEHEAGEEVPADVEERPTAADQEGVGALTTINAEAAALAKVPLFAGIGPHNLKLLAFSSRRIEFESGQVLIHQGKAGSDAYVILEGKVDIVLGEGEQESILARKGQHELFGELSLLSDTVATATVRAASPVSALQIKKEVFLQVIESDARVAIQVARVVSDRLVGVMQTLSEAR